MLHLAAPSDDDWGRRALTNIDEILLDHAHCEKKAASTALSMIFRFPEYPQLLLPMSALAREELEHFELVVALIRRRGHEFARQEPSLYAARLMTAVRTSANGRLLDTLLCCSLIEARSCERMQLITRALAERGADAPEHEQHELFRLYDSLLASEARHHAIYVELARSCLGPSNESHHAGLEPSNESHYAGLDEASLQTRLAELAEHEATIIRTADGPPRMHS